jgi:hypothetical protein
MSTHVMTTKFRVAYPKVFRAEKNDLNGNDEFSLVALFEPGADISALEAAAKAAMEKKWGTDRTLWPAGIRSPFRDQGEKKKTVDGKVVMENGKPVLLPGHVAGAIFINFKSKNKPGLVDANNNDIISESEFYGGCWARATVGAYAYDQKGNKGVAFGLQNIQKLSDGEPLGGRPKASDEFAPVASATSAPVTSANDLFK